MKIEKGSTRCVFIFKNIVIKVARIYLLYAIKTAKESLFYKIKLMKKGLRYYLNKTQERKELRAKSWDDYEKDRVRK